MPRKKRTVKSKPPGAVELALTIQKLHDYEPGLVDLIREYAIGWKKAPRLLETAQKHIGDLHSGAYSPEDTNVKMSAASDALAQAALLSKPFIPGMVRSLRRSALPPGPALVPGLTPMLTPAEYRRLWDAGIITPDSGPELRAPFRGNPEPPESTWGPWDPPAWPSNFMAPTDYELYKLDAALKTLVDAREGLTPTPVVEELPDDEAGAVKRRTRRRRRHARTKKAHKKHGKKTRRR